MTKIPHVSELYVEPQYLWYRPNFCFCSSKEMALTLCAPVWFLTTTAEVSFAALVEAREKTQ